MEKYRLGDMEMKFAEIIWKMAPIASGELVKICAVELSWKKSTTYTMLKRLCIRRIFENSNGTVKVLITKEDFLGAQGEEYIDTSFNGSLPKFIATFTKRRKLSSKDIDELKILIDNYQEE